MTEDFLHPGDEAMIASAIAEARAAGVPEETVRRVIAEEVVFADDFTTPIIAGRLGYLARARTTASSPATHGPEWLRR